MVNQGIWQASNGAKLDLTGAWSNSSGTLTVGVGSTLILEDTFTTAGLGTLVNNGGTVNIPGTLDNTGSVLALNSGTGSLTLPSDGRIKGGTITLSGGAQVVPGGGVLEGVTLNGDLDLTGPHANVSVLQGLVLNGTIYVGQADGSTYGRIYFGGENSPAGSLTGTGTVVLGGSSANSLSNRSDGSGSDGTLTIGPGTTIRGKSGRVDGGSDGRQLVNQGTINADTSGGTI